MGSSIRRWSLPNYVLESCVLWIGSRFRLVGASVDPGLLMLPGGTLLALLPWVYANVQLLWVPAGGRPICFAPRRRTAIYIAVATCIELALAFAAPAPV